MAKTEVVRAKTLQTRFIAIWGNNVSFHHLQATKEPKKNKSVRYPTKCVVRNAIATILWSFERYKHKDKSMIGRGSAGQKSWPDSGNGLTVHSRHHDTIALNQRKTTIPSEILIIIRHDS